MFLRLKALAVSISEVEESMPPETATTAFFLPVFSKDFFIKSTMICVCFLVLIFGSSITCIILAKGY